MTVLICLSALQQWGILMRTFQVEAPSFVRRGYGPGCFCLALLVAWLGWHHAGQAQGITEVITVSGTAPPDGNGAFSGFAAPALNNAGQTAFSASLTGTSGGTADDMGIYRGEAAAGSLTLILREKSRTPNSSGFTNLEPPALNAVGQLAFKATRLQPANLGGADFSNIYRASGGQLTSIAEAGDAAPDGNGDFSFFGIPALNASGQVAFFALLTGTSGGAADDSGIYRGEAAAGPPTLILREKSRTPNSTGFTDLDTPALNAVGQLAFNATRLQPANLGGADFPNIYRASGGQLTPIAEAGDAVPDGNGDFSQFGNRALNASGQVAFKAFLTGTSGGGSDDTGLFLGSGSAVTQIAREGAAVPDGNGNFSSITSSALNASGQVAFTADLTSTSGGVSDNSGIFLGSGGAITQIAREGAAAPDGNGDFSSFSAPALNASGQVAFAASLTGTSGGTTDDFGIFLANGIDTIQVARGGKTLAGDTIANFFFNPSTDVNGNERSGINDAGQVAYQAILSNGDSVIARFTIPDVHWTANASGTWSANTNWSDGIQPNSFYATFVDPANDVQVTGPAGLFHAKSLSVGGGGGAVTLSLQAGSLLGLLEGPLTIATGGTLTGSGTVDAALNNQVGGEVRLASGQNVSFNGATNENFGRITLGGGALHFEQVFTNRTGGLVIGNGTLSTAAGLSNLGNMAFSATANVVGDVTNGVSGLIATAGGTTTFLDDVDNLGEIRTSVGSSTVFFGSLTGGGTFTGIGTVVMENDFTPGSSPAEVDFGGDVVFGPAAALTIEIGGTLPGSQFDLLQIAGAATLDGTLDVSLLGGFTPSVGDSFEIIDVGDTQSGRFAGLADGALVGNFGGTDLFIDYNGGDGNDVALVATLAGDFDLDLDVDGFDFLMWQRGESPNPLSQSDLSAWQANFGNSVPFTAASAAVPEPAGAVLALTACLLLSLRRSLIGGLLRRLIMVWRPAVDGSCC